MDANAIIIVALVIVIGSAMILSYLSKKLTNKATDAIDHKRIDRQESKNPPKEERLADRYGIPPTRTEQSVEVPDAVEEPEVHEEAEVPEVPEEQEIPEEPEVPEVPEEQEIPEEPEEPEVLFCDNCGCRMPVGARFCDNCGYELIDE